MTDVLFGPAPVAAGTAMGGRHSQRAKSVVWLTPPFVLDALGPFDLDPCAHPGWVTAQESYSLPTDGLRQPWHGRVWLNPPYNKEAWRWLSRLADHGTGTALIFARVETAGFVRTVWERAEALLFLHGRLNFHTPDGARAKTNAGAPSVLVAYGADDARRLRESGLSGTFVQGWRAR